MNQLHTIRAAKALLCSVGLLLALSASSAAQDGKSLTNPSVQDKGQSVGNAPAQDLGRSVGNPIDMDVNAEVHSEVHADVTGQPTNEPASRLRPQPPASTFGPTRNQSGQSKPSAGTGSSRSLQAHQGEATIAPQTALPMATPFAPVASSPSTPEKGTSKVTQPPVGHQSTLGARTHTMGAPGPEPKTSPFGLGGGKAGLGETKLGLGGAIETIPSGHATAKKHGQGGSSSKLFGAKNPKLGHGTDKGKKSSSNHLAKSEMAK